MLKDGGQGKTAADLKETGRMNSNSKRHRDANNGGVTRTPIPFEHYEDVTDAMIEQARRESGAPAAADPKWKVVESVW